jgi:hypothetical protein
MNDAPAPQRIALVGEAGFTPVFPKVNEGVTYYWSEQNVGGAAPDVYHARVVWKRGDQVLDDQSVECSALAANETAYRTTDLSAPSQSGIDYSIELWVDMDHYADSEYSEHVNYAYHAVTVDD